MHPARNHARSVAQGACHAELGGDRLADESTLIRQLIQEVGKLGFDFKSHYRCLQGFAVHGHFLRNQETGRKLISSV
jgi:hypothetical protein